MYEVRGVYANQELLVLITKMIGKEVLLETRDGLTFEGIFAGCSPDFDVGLRCAHEVVPDEQKNLLPHKDQIIEKLQFERDCVYSMGAKYRDEKRIEGFATDREYADQSASVADMELQVWESEDDFDNGLLLNDDQEDGWSVEQMFQANDVLGVKSTFDENMPEYATADVQGDAEDLKRAERIAQEINSSSASRARAQLENDDEERDLDKEMSEFQVQHSSRKTSSAGLSALCPVKSSSIKNGSNICNAFRRGSYSGNIRDRGGMNMNRGPPNGRRSEGIPSTGRGRGSYGSGGGSSRLFTNSSMGHGVRPQNSVGSGRYAPNGLLERPTAQELHLQFGQWVRRGESSGSSSTTDGTRGGRRSEQIIGNNTRIYDHRLMTAQHEGQPTREENKNLHYSSTSNSVSGASRQQTSKQTERVRNLKEFHQNFNSTFQPSHSVHNSADDVQQDALSSVDNTAKRSKRLMNTAQMLKRTNTVQGTTVSGVAPKPINNAWNKGPPPGMRAPSSTQMTSNHRSEITSARDVETSVSIPTTTAGPPCSDQRSQQAIVKARGSVQAAVTSGPPITTATDVILTAAPECRPNKPASSTVRGSGTTSPNVEATGVVVLDTQTAAAPVAAREIQQTHQLSAAASSSSIAPTDPTPSAAVTDIAKTNATNSVTTTSDGKHFVWNPDAPSFVPRNLTNCRNNESQSHRPTLHSVRTPPAAPLPLMSTHIAAPGQIQGLALASPQALSVQNVPSIAHAGPPQMFPYAHANAYGAAMPVYYNPPVMQNTPSAAAATATAAANVTGGPIVASTTGLPIGRHGQMAGQTPATNRRNHQQQFMQGVAGMYVPGASQPYAQQLMSQYQMPYFAPYPSQLSIGASSNMPPPPIPPPSTNAVLTAPPPYQIIQINVVRVLLAHRNVDGKYSELLNIDYLLMFSISFLKKKVILQTQTQQQTGFPRQLCQSDHSVNYMISRLPQSHPIIDYTTATASAQQQPQHGSSAASSNGTGSNGPNSQPATPGPVVSPPQVHQQHPASIAQYPQSGTPQSPHAVLVPLPPGAAPPSAQPHVYVQAPQFPFITFGQPGFVIAYGPQPLVVHPSVAAPAAHVPFSQAHQTHAQQFPFITSGQPGFVMAYGPQPLVVHPSVAAPTAHAFEPSMFEQFQGTAVESAALQQSQISSTLSHQPYGTGDQFYGHYMHLNGGASGPPHQHQPFQSGGTSQNNSAPPNGQLKLFSFSCFLFEKALH
uniref:LsmAD domain-containing protein n=1 Tax=Elaeophora elaphi TaxID=1147741 RepID=A0A0R3S489_9BILA